MLRTKPFISPEKNLLAVLFALLLSLLLFPQQASAIFLNGDFEAGEFKHWTESHGLNPGLSGAPPFQASDIHIDTGGASLLSLIGRSFDPRAPQLSLPRQGNRIARLNDEQSGQHINRLTQQDTLTEADRDPVDGKLHIRFSYAAVLQSSNLPPQQQAYYHIQIKDIDDGAILYTDLGHAGQSGRSYYATVYGGQVWHSTSYIDLDLEIPDSRIGHAIEIQLHAAGSADGSAAGYLYTDALGSSPLAAQSPCLNGLAARSKPGKIQLTWPDSGAEKYRVYRADAQTGPYTQLAETNSHYSTWLDQTATNGQSYYYTVRPLDASGTEICSSAQVTVVAPPPWEAGNTVNRPPYFTSTPPVTGTTGSAYTYVAQAQDADGDPLTYQFLIAPQGMTIHAVSGAINWTPGIEGRYNVTVQASDPSGSSATQAYFITIASANRPPSITNVMTDRIPAGTPFTHQILATDPDGDALHYSIKSAINGITLNASGQIDWTDPQPGAYPVTLLVADPYGATDTQNLTLTVYNGPYFTSSPIMVGTAGTAYTYTAQAQNDDGDPITYSLTQHPGGMSINAASGQISWTPTAAGNETVTVKATDPNNDEATQTYTLVISPITIPNRPPQISSVPTMSGTVGVAYTYPVIATDPDGDLLAYTLSTAPAGMTVDAAGQINWAAPTVGAHPVAVRVSDGQMWVEQNYTLTISAGGGEGGNFTAQLSATPEFINAGESVAVLITFSGGKSPYTVVSLTLDGNPVTVSGNSATVSSNTLGLHTLIAIAKDADGTTVTEQTTFAVRDPSDVTAPVAEITAPALSTVTDSNNIAEITTLTDIIGTASDAQLIDYKLYLSRASANDWSEIGSSTTAVTNGKLGVLNPQSFANGLYDLKLVVRDTGGNTATAQIGVIINGNQKVGAFSVTFEDLKYDAMGIPLTVHRTYDTLKKSSQYDFGYGWTIDYQDVLLQTNGKLGRGWTLATVGGGLNKQICVRPSGSRVAIVRLPGGKLEQFELRASPECVSALVWYGNPFTSVEFKAKSGTTSKLEALGLDNVLRIAGNDLVDLSDEVNTLNPVQYKLTTQNGTKYFLDVGFGIRQIKDRHENTLDFSANGIIHSGGWSMHFQRDVKGRITRIDAPGDISRTYTYNAAGDLIESVDPLNAISKYSYDTQHGLLNFTDPSGSVVLKTEYDSEGHVIKQTDATGQNVELDHDTGHNIETVRDRNGNDFKYVYDERGNVTEITDAAGGTWKYTFDQFDNEVSATDPLGQVTTRTYDAFGNLTSEKNEETGEITSLEYSTEGYVSKIVDPSGRTTKNNYENGDLTEIINAEGHSVKFNYNLAGHLLSTQDTLGNTTKFSYTDINGYRVKSTETDKLGVVTTYGYDSAGRKTSQKRHVKLSASATPVELAQSHVFNANGKILSQTDAFGKTKQYTYNSLSQLVSQTDELGRATKYTYNMRGDLLKIEYPGGLTDTTAYDSKGNITSACKANLCTHYEYDVLDRVTKETSASGGSTHYAYDAAGQLTQETDAFGNTTKYTYDGAGRRIKQLDPFGHGTSLGYDTAGNLTEKTTPLGNTTRYEYNLNNRPLKLILPSGSVHQWVYDAAGRQISATDALARTSQYHYDAMDRLTGVTGSQGQKTSYAYNEAGKLLEQKDALGNTTRFDVDAAGRMAARTLPEGESETWGYDAVGNPVKHVDFDGKLKTFEYDSAGQLSKRSNADGSILQITYDAQGSPKTYNDSMAGLVTYTRNDSGLPLTVTSLPGVVGYEWDLNGNKTGLNAELNHTRYTYDARNRVSQITAPDGSMTSLEYDADGDRSRIVRGNGTVTEYVYDTDKNLSSITHKRADNTVMASFKYTLNVNGQRTQVDEAIAGNTRSVAYQYDASGQLVEEKITEGGLTRIIAYTLDALGNRTQKTDGSVLTLYTYDGNNRLLKESTDGQNIDYQYDANGNLIRKQSPSGVVTYGWNSVNQLIKVDNTATAEKLVYTYDAKGRRVKRTLTQGAKLTETEYLIDDERAYSEVALERTRINGGVWQERTYVHTPDGKGLLLGAVIEGQAMHYYEDGQGSIRVSADSHNTLAERLSYDAFGNRIAGLGGSANSVSDIHYQYGGEYYDVMTGLYHLRARDYAPCVGRFIAMDPFSGLPQQPLSLNKYLYAHADPVNSADPSGYYTQSFGYAVEDAVEIQYKAQYGVDNKSFGGKVYGLKPDILDFKRKIFMEIKPATISGVSKGITQMRVYTALYGLYNIYPDPLWMPPENPFMVQGTPTFMVNILGLLLYTDDGQLKLALALAPSLQDARRTIRYDTRNVIVAEPATRSRDWEHTLVAMLNLAPQMIQAAAVAGSAALVWQVQMASARRI